jgi:hypothetical protein
MERLLSVAIHRHANAFPKIKYPPKKVPIRFESARNRRRHDLILGGKIEAWGNPIARTRFPKFHYKCPSRGADSALKFCEAIPPCTSTLNSGFFLAGVHYLGDFT